MEAKKKDSAGRHMIPGPNRGPIFFVSYTLITYVLEGKCFRPEKAGRQLKFCNRSFSLLSLGRFSIICIKVMDEVSEEHCGLKNHMQSHIKDSSIKFSSYLIGIRILWYWKDQLKMNSFPLIHFPFSSYNYTAGAINLKVHLFLPEI
ncbi:hypothetical protein Lal_00049771 [Lupinus albus]|nr:hypothetical protein Lal_00049771 [Lupinus albus]